ncbi:ABC transporter permease [Chryseolinea sp. T2]|uniref:ABC transporter permease n=1 Tax=Chryseolinea sp. T2 TaxID=3129255 RepID=UPI0030772447
MIRNYFLVTLRSMLRNKVFSIITVCGLSIAITASFLLYQYVLFESGYDRFQSEHIYRVALKQFQGNSLDGGLAANTSAMGPALKRELPEVVNFTRLVKTSLFTSSLTKAVTNALEFSHDADHTLVAFNEEGVYFADAPFLTMFSFPLLAGDPQKALAEPYTVVITESMAKKYFGSEPALGKTLLLNRELSLTVTGVLKDIPENSHLRFDILISYPTIMRTYDGDDFWGWTVFYTYVQLVPGSDIGALESKINEYVKKRAPDFSDYLDYHRRVFFQPVADIHLNSRFWNEQSPAGDSRTIYFLSLLSVLILFIAWINYINLSTAKGLERSKEVGLRKVVGASRGQLVIQFLTDAFVVNLSAVLTAIALAGLLWPFFKQLVGKDIQLAFFTSPATWGVAGIFLLVGVLVIGSYPAMMLSSFNPAQVLKGKFLKSSRGASARKLMISFQYFVALLLIAGTLLSSRQLSHLLSQDTGYVKDQIVVIEGPAVYDSMTNTKVNLFRKSLSEIPGVTGMTASANVPGQSITEGSGFIKEGGNWDDAMGAAVLGTDTSFFNTYGIRITEGRRFNENESMDFRRKKDAAENIRLVANHEFVNRLGLTPQTALNQKISFWWGPDQRDGEIVGVVADHHQQSLKDPYEAIVYMQPQWSTWKYFSIRMSADRRQQKIEAIEEVFKNVFTDNPFVTFQLDDYYDEQYDVDKKLGLLVRVFTVLAIIITCLGLVGLTVFTVSQRMKEMGIRKVLGSSTIQILYLFSRDLVRILVASYVLAIPLIILGGRRWLTQFTSSVGVEWQVVALPVIILFMITVLVVSALSVKRALESPVKALKYE